MHRYTDIDMEIFKRERERERRRGREGEREHPRAPLKVLGCPSGLSSGERLIDEVQYVCEPENDNMEDKDEDQGELLTMTNMYASLKMIHGRQR